MENIDKFMNGMMSMLRTSFMLYGVVSTISIIDMDKHNFIGSSECRMSEEEELMKYHESLINFVENKCLGVFGRINKNVSDKLFFEKTTIPDDLEEISQTLQELAKKIYEYCCLGDVEKCNLVEEFGKDLFNDSENVFVRNIDDFNGLCDENFICSHNCDESHCDKICTHDCLHECMITRHHIEHNFINRILCMRNSIEMAKNFVKTYDKYKVILDKAEKENTKYIKVEAETKVGVNIANLLMLRFFNDSDKKDIILPLLEEKIVENDITMMDVLRKTDRLIKLVQIITDEVDCV